MLGSIPELPAETCKEIKASEGGEAVSGKYWFDSIIPGETVLAHCDMKKEGNEGWGKGVWGGGGGWRELGGFENRKKTSWDKPNLDGMLMSCHGGRKKFDSREK